VLPWRGLSKLSNIATSLAEMEEFHLHPAGLYQCKLSNYVMVLPMPRRPQYSASVRFRTGACAKLSPTDAKVSANTILQ
jgi:hypothetical protein